MKIVIQAIAIDEGGNGTDAVDGKRPVQLSSRASRRDDNENLRTLNLEPCLEP